MTASAALFVAGALLVTGAGRLGASSETQSELQRLLRVQAVIVLPVLVGFWAGGLGLALGLAVFALRGVHEIFGVVGGAPGWPARTAATAALLASPPLMLALGGPIWLGLIAIALAGLVALARPALPRSAAVALVGLGGCLLSVQVLAGRPGGAGMLIAAYLAVETCDAFAAVCGRLWGRTPLAPRLSPRKTIEGLVGGVSVALPASTALFAAGLDLGPSAAFALASAIVAAGLAGDVGASWFKRQYDLKDFPPVLAIHGGVLDIYDSLLAAAPVALAGSLILAGG